MVSVSLLDQLFRGWTGTCSLTVGPETVMQFPFAGMAMRQPQASELPLARMENFGSGIRLRRQHNPCKWSSTTPGAFYPAAGEDARPRPSAGSPVQSAVEVQKSAAIRRNRMPHLWRLRMNRSVIATDSLLFNLEYSLPLWSVATIVMRGRPPIT
jgi:hypothetical protein